MTYTRYRNRRRDRNNNNPAQHRLGEAGSFNGRAKRPQPKKLDPNLFIKHLAPEEHHQVETTSIDSDVEFSSFNIVDKLKQNIANHGYDLPTQIQAQAIPPILEGRDIIGIANTGTGKTAAFLITLINKCIIDRTQRVLIVVPTRELALQINDEFMYFAKDTGVSVVALIGGANINRQQQALKRDPSFVIGTPGRIKDLIQRNDLNLSRFNNIVLDEVDRMVDIGFIKDIKNIISLLPKVRQSLFFSATVDNRTQEILETFVNNAVRISVKSADTSDNVEQDIVRITGERPKIEVLHDLLDRPGFDKVIVFGRTKWAMEKLSRALRTRGFRTAAIHGNKSQNQRQRALEDFREGKIQVLIATDVASRGIDIEDVTHVINYDAPTSYDDYIHRIGRTGRAGKRGVALTFVD
ncbi:MAG TPA: DEAD/DEAH box helicase [Patescibacteria group bacterium]|nr:DEAD/DEAH box helicase [Patescibacteria group bacterium]